MRHHHHQMHGRGIDWQGALKHAGSLVGPLTKFIESLFKGKK